MEKAEEFVKSATQGRVVGVATEVPLADGHGGVTRFIAEAVGESLFRNGQPDARILIGRADGIELKAETRLVAPRHQACPRGRAKGSGYVAVREAHPVLRDGVDLRGWHVGGRMLHTCLADSEIVRHDPDDVRRKFSGSKDAAKRKGEDQKLAAIHRRHCETRDYRWQACIFSTIPFRPCVCNGGRLRIMFVSLCTPLFALSEPLDSSPHGNP